MGCKNKEIYNLKWYGNILDGTLSLDNKEEYIQSNLQGDDDEDDA